MLIICPSYFNNL